MSRDLKNIFESTKKGGVEYPPPRMRQGGGRYNRGGYIERSEYRQWFSVCGIAAS